MLVFCLCSGILFFLWDLCNDDNEEKEEKWGGGRTGQQGDIIAFYHGEFWLCSHDLKLPSLTPPTIRYHQSKLAVKLLHKLNCSVTYLSGN